MLEATVLFRTRDRPALLDDAVRSVLGGSHVPREVLVVDQSRAPDRAALRALDVPPGCTVRHLPSATRGLARATNVGLRAAAHELVVLMDDDMLVEQDWLERLLSGLAGAGPLVVVTGRVLPTPPDRPGLVLPYAALVQGAEPATYRGRQARDVMPGANVALRRSAILGLGGYDERLGAGTRYRSAEDNDMGLRLLEAGGEVRHVPDAVVLHRVWRRRLELLATRWAYGRGKGAFYAKHARGDGYVRERLTADLRLRVRRSVRSPRSAPGDAIYVAGAVTGAVEWALRERPGRRRA